jgi:hypothetical protein
MNKYDDLYKVIRWCRTHNRREFYQFEVEVHPRSIGALCDSNYRGKTWLSRVGRSKRRDGTRGRWRYITLRCR